MLQKPDFKNQAQNQPVLIQVGEQDLENVDKIQFVIREIGNKEILHW